MIDAGSSNGRTTGFGPVYVGSNPAPAYARVVQLVETLDLGSRCWEFESLHEYHLLGS